MLIVEKLNQYYGGSHTLRGLTLEIQAGKVTTLLGRNGVGKSTLLKCMMGLLPLQSGVITWNGKDVSGLPTHTRVAMGFGYVPQGREIFARLTVEENLLIGAASRRHNPGIPAALFQLFPILKDMRKRRGGDLSGGQQQQLAIGRALMGAPQLLMLDEPTEGIQPSIIEDIGRAIQKLAAGEVDMALSAGGMSILLVEQYYDFARRLADHYAVMARGEIIAAGLGSEMDAQNVKSLIAV
jgi:urea transport system ATP-binding protein